MSRKIRELRERIEILKEGMIDWRKHVKTKRKDDSYFLKNPFYPRHLARFSEKAKLYNYIKLSDVVDAVNYVGSFDKFEDLYDDYYEFFDYAFMGSSFADVITVVLNDVLKVSPKAKRIWEMGEEAFMDDDKFTEFLKEFSRIYQKNLEIFGDNIDTGNLSRMIYYAFEVYENNYRRLDYEFLRQIFLYILKNKQSNK